LSNDKVWAEGLLVFYEVFKFLENHVPIEMLPEEYRRTAKFEQDLKFYLGDDWKNDYEPRDSVQIYLEHLKDIAENKPLLLIAYVYHLYMGLLSGGQILQKKREILRKFNRTTDSNTDGYAVTTFPNFNISELKERMRELVDNLAIMMDPQTKQDILEESKIVFELNNQIVRSIESANAVSNAGFIKIAVIVLFSIIFIFIKKYVIPK